jgi:hypothetical protein
MFWNRTLYFSRCFTDAVNNNTQIVFKNYNRPLLNNVASLYLLSARYKVIFISAGDQFKCLLSELRQLSCE